ncbi:SH3-like domain-containing protein [Pseudomonas syringae]|uniref:SH3-like domain-containing protein n=1 Tax=Pseudomonas syringae TaxID=317 RepID=UPI00020987DE|nr:SH3-like domain-containing protein [Pseudomonas syringae]EGH71512.1 hypothetical protein PSYAR_13234 [Pseudomonas syringae pv. aceris str. M302273]KOG03517.1 Uncharacterized protein ABJ98_2355 [Pseudomonas syringae pv. aceris]
MTAQFSSLAEALSIGTAVTIHDAWPEEHEACHIRTPAYVRGKSGFIERYLGEYPSPEELAFGRPAPLCRLYHVRFTLSELWPTDNTGAAEALVEIYEHWMQPRGHS